MDDATDLAATLRQLADAASTPLWTVQVDSGDASVWRRPVRLGGDPEDRLIGDVWNEGNAQFVAWCRNNAEAIATALERGAAAEAVVALGQQLNAPLHLVPDASQLMRDRALFVAYDAALAAYEALVAVVTPWDEVVAEDHTDPEYMRLFEAAGDFLPNDRNVMVHPLVLLNTSICTAPGDYAVSVVSVEGARQLVNTMPVCSAIGHQATADALTELLGIDVPMNRIVFEQQPGQLALALKLRGRLSEGVILDRPGLDKIGFDLWLMQRKGLVLDAEVPEDSSADVE